ncbi:2,3-diketo-5-methylthio-1-phosphopentane phosphatase [Thioalkalivibrio sulfidiphilus HL-EbGr7]|uniref:Enolase-phosphatase E1 n=1 Tax=Thioalkalivibrio sulfidiphilus (strain HL-EbGR7) TaxID=396588 RepID=MTNC_THISH|nr:acireductone synthase [Thioalkalivibrio sulfidiphilus]B8GMB3.1 RecName: Full=Enolase-phosphatase E1; AltName: Full=2,3-diketo-5-methylthio-1-phosphopentane phosphatase [Thioalkalivibrio sulfidiphilus HL-EbGr7]ACL73700.1 2,3-diketo-5-methylthio-1-phosphopentane phosphatase [Thioalkalivibrio sulfidiphilus HL-EbGr7]
MTKIILTDIEGTTSSLSFVKDVLFPYAREHLPEFVRGHRDDTEVKRLLADARAYAGGDLDEEALIERMIGWIDNDQKITPLKALQGLIWEDGYARGDFQGHVYEDAVAHLRQWHQQGLRLAVYSSGSVHAQKLLFGHTAFGDLNPLFEAYFDTRIGGKRDTASYKAIAKELGVEPREVLFLSDLRAELDAAAEAGMKTTALDRAGNGEDFGPHPVARDFAGVGV